MSESTVNLIWELTRKMVEDFYPRLTGTPGCQQAVYELQNTLKQSCDTVEIQKFEHHPTGFLKFLPFAALIHFIALLLFILQYNIIAFMLFSLNAFAFVSQLLFYWGFFDFPFPKSIGQNVIGTIEPSEDVRQQIVLSAHYDAPYVFQFIEKFPRFYPTLLAAGLTGVIINFLISSIMLFHFLTLTWYLIAIVSFVSVPVLIFFVFTTNTVSPGAGDNAVAAAIITGFANIVTTERLSHTRIIILASDAEEAGLNGTRAYVNNYKSALTALPTFDFNIDSIFSKKNLLLFTRDLNSMRKLSNDEASFVASLGKQLGQPLPMRKMPFGGGATDAAEFARIGIPAISLVGLDVTTFDGSVRYHSSRDTMEGQSKSSINFILQLLTAYVQAKDSIY